MRFVRSLSLIMTVVMLAGSMFTAAAAQAAYANRTPATAHTVPGGIQGIDVSRWQGNINWQRVAQDNVNFAFVRATYGLETCSAFYANATGAHQAGIKVGAYHFATFNDRASMLREARAFVTQLDRVNLSYPAVLDIEHARGLSRSALTTLVIEFTEYVRQQGYPVMIYSYANFFRDNLELSRLGGYNLWVANYVREPDIPNMRIWQFTDRGRVAGIQGGVDLNIAYADMTWRRNIVDVDISRSIKAYLNERYDAGFDIEAALDWPKIEDTLYRGLQTELGRIIDNAVAVDGNLTEFQQNSLSNVQLRSDAKGAITTLIQCMLFYRGYYEHEITGIFDDYTARVIGIYQRDQRLTATSTMTRETWQRLFPTKN